MRPFLSAFLSRIDIFVFWVVPPEPQHIMGLKQKVTISPTTVREWRQMVESWSPEERKEKEKRLVRRIDWHLLPILVGPDLGLHAVL